MSLTKEEIIEAVARGWCHLPDRVMDPPLALFIAGEVQAALAAALPAGPSEFDYTEFNRLAEAKDAAQPKAPSPTPGEVELAIRFFEAEATEYEENEERAHCTRCGAFWKEAGTVHGSHCPVAKRLATLRAALPAQGWSFDMDAAPLNVQVLLQMRRSYRPYADRDPDWQYDVGYRTDHNNGGFVHARAGTPVAWMPLPTPPNAEPERSGE